MTMATATHPPETRNRILETARRHFFAQGFTKVTMDEIAHELGMSKKTLYQHFPAKRDLLQESLLGINLKITEGLDGIVQNKRLDFSKKLEQALGFVASELPRFSPIFLRDIQRHAPDLWQELDRRRSRSIKKYMGLITFLERAKQTESLPEWQTFFSTHPATDERIQRLNQKLSL